MRIFSAEYLDDLSGQARDSLRRRQHRNIHRSHQEPCQRLFNAIEPDSYIRPHKHATDPRDELLVAVRGLMALVTFDERGKVTGALHFGSEKHAPNIAAGAEVPPDAWHTVIALEPGSVLLEVKAGPFDPNQPKDLAAWAPEDGSAEAREYLGGLDDRVLQLGGQV